MAQSATRKPKERTALYRIWGDGDQLLYIGISNNFGTRWKTHAKQQPWWDEMRRLSADAWYDDRDEAEAIEAAAIKAERPKYNKLHAVPAVRASQPRTEPPRPSTAHAPQPFRECHCREPGTRKPLHSRCPRLSEPDHGAWYVRHEIPVGASGWDSAKRRNQRQLGPFTSKAEAAYEVAEVLNGYAEAGFRVTHLPPRRKRPSARAAA